MYLCSLPISNRATVYLVCMLCRTMAVLWNSIHFLTFFLLQWPSFLFTKKNTNWCNIFCICKEVSPQSAYYIYFLFAHWIPTPCQVKFRDSASSRLFSKPYSDICSSNTKSPSTSWFLQHRRGFCKKNRSCPHGWQNSLGAGSAQGRNLN